jgi:hypothetical protein
VKLVTAKGAGRPKSLAMTVKNADWRIEVVFGKNAGGSIWSIIAISRR